MVTLDEINAAKTVNGSWTKAQLAEWGVPWPPPRGWKKALVEGKSLAEVTATAPPVRQPAVRAHVGGASGNQARWLADLRVAAGESVTDADLRSFLEMTDEEIRRETQKAHRAVSKAQGTKWPKVPRVFRS